MLHNPEGVLDKLSNREKETLDLFFQLGRQKSVAEHLGLSPKTINAYLANVQRKFGVSNVVELIHYCIQKGIIEP